MKKVFAMLLVIVFCLMMTACGEKDNLTSKNENDVDVVVSQVIDDNNTNKENVQGKEEVQNQNNVINNSKPSSNQTPNNSSVVSQTTANNTPSHVCSYSPATCTSPAKCSCGATVGNELGHYYNKATCTEAAKCSRCGTSNGSALGHDYNDGKCKKCGQKDPNYTEMIYSVGQTWIVDGQWEFTITGVKKHHHCNDYWDSTVGLEGSEEVVLIEYTYKNIGYEHANGLYMWSLNFSVYDQDGESAETYACLHDVDAKQCMISGTKSSGTIAYSLKNPSSQITLVIRNMHTSDTKEEKTARFSLFVS